MKVSKRGMSLAGLLFLTLFMKLYCVGRLNLEFFTCSLLRTGNAVTRS